MACWKNLATRFEMTILLVLLTTLLFVVGIVAWYAWELHPWIPAGRLYSLGHWHFGDCEFEVWQRKNISRTEPFADGLFVRYGTNQWETYCFDFQDSYSPKIELSRESGRVIVYSDHENRGAYDLATHTFRRHGQLYQPVLLGSGTNPPGNWKINN